MTAPRTPEGGKEVAELRRDFNETKMHVDLLRAYLELALFVPKIVLLAVVFGVASGAGVVGLIWWLT